MYVEWFSNEDIWIVLTRRVGLVGLPTTGLKTHRPLGPLPEDKDDVDGSVPWNDSGSFQRKVEKPDRVWTEVIVVPSEPVRRPSPHPYCPGPSDIL